MVNSPGDVFAAPLKALGYSLELGRSDELDEARELLKGLAPHVLVLDSDHYEEKPQHRGGRPRPDLDGRSRRLRGEPETEDIEYIIPSDGTLYWLDMWAILTSAPHPGPRTPS